MSELNFPANPDVDDVHIVGDTAWRWNGKSWVSNSVFNGRFPAGTTDQRPAAPKRGMIRYNTEFGVYEGYDNSGWRPFRKWVRTPVGISPINNEEILTSSEFTLTSSPFEGPIVEHASSDWQIASDESFNNIVLESLENTSSLTSFEVTNGIISLGSYYWRVRYRDLEGNVSKYSNPLLFSIIPPELGDSFQGGFYIGTTSSINNTCYYLIVAPNAAGCAACIWKTTRTLTSGTGSCVDGFANTYPALNNTTHPAGNWTATRTINGFNDWYLPARDELNQLYVNNGGTTNTTLPTGEGFAAAGYWSSTENSLTAACFQTFGTGGILLTYKTVTFCVRAVRRTPI